jgi:hypothetical protein
MSDPGSLEEINEGYLRTARRSILLCIRSRASSQRLLEDINAAVKAVNEAERGVTTARAELVSRSKRVGLLLLEAKKQHPTVKDFEAFLKKVDGLNLSRAYDLLKLAGGRTTDGEIRRETRERVKKHREKKRSKAPKANPSVTPPDVTEKPPVQTWMLDNDVDPARRSAYYLAEFIAACRAYLPKVTEEADRQKARDTVATLTCPDCAKREAA